MSGEQQLVDVQIDRDNHTHAGVAIPKGSTIAVSEDTARWLEEQKIGHRLSAGSARRPAKPATDEAR